MVSWWEKGPARRRTVLASLGTACVGGAIINGGIAKGDNMASIVMAGLGTAMFLGIVEPRGNEPPLDEVEKRIRENSLDFWQQEIRHRGLHRRLFIPPALTVIEEGELVEKPITFRKPFWTQADFAAKIGALLTEQEVRRAVVYGRGGSGKSLLAMMGMIGMMERPDEGAPVPLLLSLSSWRSTETFESWINRYLVSTYPATRLLSGEGDGGRIGRLARCGRFMIVLDGFDELPRSFHAEALRQINDLLPAPDPLVVLSRQMNSGLNDRLAIQGAVHVGVDDLAPLRVADHLQSLDPLAEPGLRKLANHIRRDPGGPLASIFTRPLYVELAVDAIRGGDLAVSDFEDIVRRGGVRAGESFLLEIKIRRTLDRPGIAGRLRARHWLEYIAAQMSRKDVGSVAWFHTIGWVPSSVISAAAALCLLPGFKIALLMPVGLTRGLALGLVAGTGFGLMRGVRPGVVAAVWSFVTAGAAVAAVGLMSEPVAQTVADATEIALTAGLSTLFKEQLLAHRNRHRPYAIAIVLAMGLAIAAATKGVGLALGFDDPNRDFTAVAVAVVFGLGIAVIASRILIHDPLHAQPSSVLLTMRRRQGGTFRHIRSGIISATAIGVAGGLGGALRFGFQYGWALIIIFGLAIGIPVGLVGGVIKWLSAPPLTAGRYSEDSPMRNDRLTAIGVVLAISGAAAGGVAALTGPPLAALNSILQRHSGSTLQVAPVDGILFGLTIGVVVACYNSAWLAFFVSHAYLVVRRRLPWRLFTFLEALHRSELLRREGLHYQFRNIEMQDHLARRHLKGP